MASPVIEIAFPSTSAISEPGRGGAAAPLTRSRCPVRALGAVRE
jgi:hypothetical protein